EAIFSEIDIDPLIYAVSKKSIYGAPTSLNYPAMIYGCIARIHEGIPTIKKLVQRLKNDLIFRLDCGFLLSDNVPSESSFSRLIHLLSKSNAIEKSQNTLVRQAIQEGFIKDDMAAVDVTHFEARDRAKASEKKEPIEPKKRGRKSKKEREQWLKEQVEQEAGRTLYEKEIAHQLSASLDELRSEVPLTPTWGIKKNSERKNVAWFGYKAHLAVGTQSQYILQTLMSSASLSDGKGAIPLIKGIHETLHLTIRYGLLDAGYDFKAIYQQLHNMNAQGIIAYNPRNEQEVEGFDGNFSPTCVREHSYQYDSYDSAYHRLKYTRPKECKECPLANDTLCQKVYKIKRLVDIRKYVEPVRGSQKWKTLYKQRTSVERVNAYLKEYFQLNNVRHRSGKVAKVHFDLVTLIYNGTKLAIDRMNRKVLQNSIAV
ncbi:IS5/IS1182 family transposase, partial [Bacillus solimangrovi]